MKKSLIFWFAAVTCAALFLVGCESPTNGESGADGKNIGLADGTNVSAADLAAWFLAADIVTLGPDVDTVEGVVPGGKKLIVSGTSTAVGDSSIDGTETLEIKAGGTLEIAEGAALNAGYTSSAGYLKGSGAISGAVALPYFGAGVTGAPVGIVTYNSPNAPAGKSVGGYVAGGSAAYPVSALDKAGIEAIFATDVTALSVGDITTPIVPGTVPAGKTLTVNGAASIGATFDFHDKGTLIVGPEGTLTAGGAYNITGASENANVVIKGTLSVGGNVTIAGKVDLSAANVTNSTAITLTLPAGDVEIGTILTEDESNHALTIAGATGLVVGSISGGTGGVKSTSVLKYYVAGTNKADYVGLGTAAANLVITGLDGSTFDVTHSATLGSVLTIGGAAKVKGALTDETGANFALTTANLGKLVSGSSVTYSGAVTGTAETLVIPAGITVNSGASGTLATITGLQVDGDLTVNAALTLAGVSAASAITGEGSVTAAAAVTSKPALKKLIESGVATVSFAETSCAIGALTIPANTTRVSTANGFAPDNTIAVNGVLILEDDAKIVNAVTITGSGALVLETGKNITLGNASAKIAGGTAYEFTPEEDQTTGTLAAGVDNTGVAFLAARIDGVDDEGTPLVEKTTDPTSAATLTFGTADSTLTIKGATAIGGVILDVATKGKIVVRNGYTLMLALGAGTNHVGSGGIFTKAVSGGSGNTVVKANAATPKSSDGAFGTADVLGSAAVENQAASGVTATGNIGTGGSNPPASGTITASTGDVTIDKDDTFAVSDAAITVTSA